MKVVSNPVELPDAYWDSVRVGNLPNWTKMENDYKAQTHRHFVELGYTGPRTGGIVRIPHADGYAAYLFADKGNSGVLVHLAIGDAWNSPLAAKLTRKDVIAAIDRENKLRSLFGER